MIAFFGQKAACFCLVSAIVSPFCGFGVSASESTVVTRYNGGHIKCTEAHTSFRLPTPKLHPVPECIVSAGRPCGAGLVGPHPSPRHTPTWGPTLTRWINFYTTSRAQEGYASNYSVSGLLAGGWL